MTGPLTAGLHGKNVLITGATAGIGLATAQALAAQGAHLTLVARDPARGEQVAAELRAQGAAPVRVLAGDLASLGSVRQVAQAFEATGEPLHVLINNAGLFSQTRQQTRDGHELTFGVNHLAPFLLTGLLLDTLRQTPGARIINVSSSAQAQGHIAFDDLMGTRRYRPFAAYSQSKLANVLFTYELTRRLGPADVTVNALHPGVVNSNFGSGSTGLLDLGFRVLKRVGAISPQQGAQTSVFLAGSPDVAAVTGKFFDRQRPVRTSRESYDEGVARRLWEVSAGLTGL